MKTDESSEFSRRLKPNQITITISLTTMYFQSNLGINYNLIIFRQLYYGKLRSIYGYRRSLLSIHNSTIPHYSEAAYIISHAHLFAEGKTLTIPRRATIGIVHSAIDRWESRHMVRSLYYTVLRKSGLYGRIAGRIPNSCSPGKANPVVSFCSVR